MYEVKKYYLALIVMVVGACSIGCFQYSYKYEEVSLRRDLDQTYFEDSTDVFFATYPNPYTDREFLWFASFAGGEVEMRVHNASNDSLISIYRFQDQQIPLYTLVCLPGGQELVKCVVYVDGRPKCAKLYPEWDPLQITYWTTQYTIEQP